MGKVLSVVTKPLRNFNIESRAHKVISRDKPTPAPKHKADAIDYQRIMKEHPEIIEGTSKKHEQLDRHLKDVFVTSHDPELKKLDSNQDPNRPLPLDRKAVGDFEFGFKEPTKLAHGKTTLRKVLRFISEHQQDPKVYNYKKIAEDHLLPEEKVRNILKYFRVYEVYIPEQKSKASFATPSIPRTHVTIIKPKRLGSGKGEKDET